MKYLISISLLFIYLGSSLQSSWVLIDFYAHRDDYTQKYCLFLDQGITQCRASCYLDTLLDEEKKDKEANVISAQRENKQEQISEEQSEMIKPSQALSNNNFYYSDTYHFEAIQFIFRPPKG